MRPASIQSRNVCASSACRSVSRICWAEIDAQLSVLFRSGRPRARCWTSSHRGFVVPVQQQRSSVDADLEVEEVAKVRIGREPSMPLDVLGRGGVASQLARVPIMQSSSAASCSETDPRSSAARARLVPCFSASRPGSQRDPELWPCATRVAFSGRWRQSRARRRALTSSLLPRVGIVKPQSKRCVQLRADVGRGRPGRVATARGGRGARGGRRMTRRGAARGTTVRRARRPRSPRRFGRPRQRTRRAHSAIFPAAMRAIAEVEQEQRGDARSPAVSTRRSSPRSRSCTASSNAARSYACPAARRDTSMACTGSPELAASHQ